MNNKNCNQQKTTLICRPKNLRPKGPLPYNLNMMVIQNNKFKH